MFDIGSQEILVILVVALIVIGPKKLPDLAKALGRGIAEFKKATHEMKKTILEDEELKSAKEEIVDSAHEVRQTVKEEFKKGYSSFDEVIEDYQKMKESVSNTDVKEKKDGNRA